MPTGKRKPRRVTGQEPLSYMGVEATTPPQVITSGRDDPTVNNYNFDLGTIWVNWSTNDAFILVNIEANVAEWVRINNQNLTVNGNTGSAVSVDDVIYIVGSGVLETSGTGSTLTIEHTSASDGQLIIGELGGDPAWGNLTSSGGTMDITEGPGTLNIDIKSGFLGAQDFATDSGTATITGNTITIAGGTNINTAGAGSTVTINLDNDVVLAGNLTAVDADFTNLQVTSLGTGFLESDASGNVSNSEGTDGQLIIGATGAAAAWANLTSTGGTMQITGGANTLNIESIAGLASPYIYTYADWGGGGPVNPVTDTSEDGTTVLMTKGTGVQSSTTALPGSWVSEGVIGTGGNNLSGVHIASGGATVCVASQNGAAPGNFTIIHATSPTGTYTSYSIVGGTTDTFTSVSHDGTYWVITGTNGATNGVYHATDPTGAWTFNSSGLTSQPLNDCAFGNNTWVVVGDNGKIAYQLTDPTGAWTDIPAATSGFDDVIGGVPINISSITYSSALGLFCAVSNQSRIATSPDGITWTQRNANLPILTNNFLDIHWDSTNGLFLAVGANGCFSYNGISWFRDNSLDGGSWITSGDINGTGFVFKTSNPENYFVDRA